MKALDRKTGITLRVTTTLLMQPLDSRGLYAGAEAERIMYRFHGPSFLWEPMQCWPQTRRFLSPKLSNCDSDVKVVHSVTMKE